MLHTLVVIGITAHNLEALAKLHALRRLDVRFAVGAITKPAAAEPIYSLIGLELLSLHGGSTCLM